MALKRPTTLLSLPLPARTTICHQCRALHRLHAPTLRIPKPTPFVPDVPTFLTLIGRGLSAHASKIPSWEALFSLSSAQLREAGVEPARARRYLLWWRERFRNGVTGIGGDISKVKDGVAELRIAEVPSQSPSDAVATLTRSKGMRKIVVNVEPSVALPKDAEAAAKEGEGEEANGEKPRRAMHALLRLDDVDVKPVSGVKIVAGDSIAGTGVEAVKGYHGVARLRVTEGLWEERRGHKVDGGERRKAEVRYKRRAQERKNAR